MSKKTIIAIIAILILLAMGAGFWKWKSMQKVSQQVQNQQQQVQQQNSNQQSVDNQQLQQIPEDQLVWYEIPELNIKFKVTKSVASELIYKIKNAKDSYGYASFSSRKLSLIPGCAASSGALSTFEKISGKPRDYSEKDYFLNGRLLKQFDNFFVMQDGRQDPCAMGDDSEKMKKYFKDNPEFTDWSYKAFETMEIFRR
jgi:hypothetical protein